MSDASNRSVDPSQFPVWRVSPESADSGAEIDLPLAAWQIVDVDGEVVRAVEDEESAAARPPLRIIDQADDVIVAAIATRQFTATAGEPVILVVTIVNNGPSLANFRVRLEGWIDARWGGEAQELMLDAGQRGTVELQIHAATPARCGSRRLSPGSRDDQ